MTCNFIKNGELILIKSPQSQSSSVNISAINLKKTTLNKNINIKKFLLIKKIIKKIIKNFIILLILIFFIYLIKIFFTKDFIIELASNNPQHFFNANIDNFLINSLKNQNVYTYEPKVNIPNFQKIG
jgi:hypothetical protein